MQGVNLTTGKVGQFRTYQKDRIITKFDNESEVNLYDLTDNSDHTFSVLATTNPRSKKSTTTKIDTFDKSICIKLILPLVHFIVIGLFI